MRSSLTILLICLVISGFAQGHFAGFTDVTPVSADDSPETRALKAAQVVPSSRQAAWQELEFTVFLHFGINTFTNREWGRKGEDPLLFNPTELDAGQWARTAKMAGAHLMIIVAKHHDGFCLWPTKFTDFSVKASPWKNGNGDVVGEVATACREEGLKVGIYLSPWDMNAPEYGTEEYNTHFKNQLRELLTQYGQISEVWFDGACGEGPNGKKQVYDWTGYYRLIRELQPEAVIAITGPDVRWVGNETGDGNETEWSVVQDPDGLRWYPSEVDVSIRPGWFYHPSEDTLVKSPEELVDVYYKSVGRNSVLLLNIPPDTRGLIHENDVRSLQGMRDILDKTFKTDLAAEAMVTTVPGGLTGSAGYDLGSEKSFDCMLVQEDFRNGQKVASFCLEVFINGRWKEVCRGTTIGYKRLMRFEPVTARQVRLRILESRGIANIISFRLYKAQ